MPSVNRKKTENGVAANSTKTACVAARVRKHRAKLRTEQCRRLDVWIGADIIEEARQVAKEKHIPLWEIVQDALEACTNAHAAAANGKPSTPAS